MTSIEERAAELESIADRLATITRELRTMAARDTGILQPELEPEPERPERPQIVQGRFGAVTAAVALARAQDLGEFTQAQFAEKLGLKSPEHRPWLDVLMRSGALRYANARYQCLVKPSLFDWVIHRSEPFTVEAGAKATELPEDEVLAELESFVARGMVDRIGESDLFRYKPPQSPSGPFSRPDRLPPEKERPSYTEVPPRGEPVRRSASDKASRKERSTPGQRHQIVQRDRRYEQMQEARKQRAEANKAKAQKDPKWQSRNGRRK